MYNHNFMKEMKKSQPERNSGEIKVEKGNYLPAKKRIENLMLAGQRLNQSRQESYDFPDGNIDENFFDPTRNKSFDMADAFQLSQMTEARLKAFQTAQEQREEAKKEEIDSKHVEEKTT